MVNSFPCNVPLERLTAHPSEASPTQDPSESSIPPAASRPSTRQSSPPRQYQGQLPNRSLSSLFSSLLFLLNLSCEITPRTISLPASLLPICCWKNSLPHNKTYHPATNIPSLAQVLPVLLLPNSPLPIQDHPSYNRGLPGSCPLRYSIPYPYPISLHGAYLLLRCTSTCPEDPLPIHKGFHRSCSAHPTATLLPYRQPLSQSLRRCSYTPGCSLRRIAARR